MPYKLIDYENLVEGQLILGFGHHVLRWDFERMGTPRFGIVEMSDTLQENLQELLADLEDLSDEELIACRKVMLDRINECLEEL